VPASDPKQAPASFREAWVQEKVMNLRPALAAIAFLLAFGSHPAVAGTTNIPPGNPCFGNTGNPCNQNNGNLGQQGNVNHERVTIDKKPPPISIPMPAISQNAAYIEQIGEGNSATINQTARVAYAKVEQDGSGNSVTLSQNGIGKAYADIQQKGSANVAAVQQGGSGQNVLYLNQSGSSNWAWANQNAAGAVHNGARMTQTGNNNDMALTQLGSDNLALLTQEGDGNGMSATQVGDGNRLAWTQQGNGLTDLQIVQSGGMEKGGQLAITQTGGTGGN
jgi:hypothetical protein